MVAKLAIISVKSQSLPVVLRIIKKVRDNSKILCTFAA